LAWLGRWVSVFLWISWWELIDGGLGFLLDFVCIMARSARDFGTFIVLIDLSSILLVPIACI
jgi:hypothetical protein